MIEPLTPPDCDLRGLPFMPLDVVRLMDSDLFALATGDEFKAALALWCKSWLQVPAASLPDDDRVLAHLSGAGTRWRKVKEMALRGWVKCIDGRLYHDVVAEKANAAWERRGDWQEKQSSKNDRQQRWRDHVKAASAELRSLGVTPPMNASLKELERLLVDARASTHASTAVSTVDSLERERERDREKEKKVSPPNPQPQSEPSMPPDLQAVMDEGAIVGAPDYRVLKGWYEMGADLQQDILPVIRKVITRDGKRPSSLKYFTDAIREKLAADVAEIERFRNVSRRYEGEQASENARKAAP